MEKWPVASDSTSIRHNTKFRHIVVKNRTNTPVQPICKHAIDVRIDEQRIPEWPYSNKICYVTTYALPNTLMHMEYDDAEDQFEVHECLDCIEELIRSDRDANQT